MPVQVDGEPWVQSPGDVVVLKSALKVSVIYLIQIYFCLKFVAWIFSFIVKMCYSLI